MGINDTPTDIDVHICDPLCIVNKDQSRPPTSEKC